MRDGPGIVVRHKDFGRIWLAHVLSAVGSHLSVLALPLLVLDHTGSATLAGLVGTIRMLAYVLANLPGGALADRLPRRAILLAADATRAVLVLTIGVSVLSGHLSTPALILLGAADTAISAVAGPAAVAAIRRLVPDHDIPAALAVGTAGGLAAGLVGPVLGGVLYQVHPALPFVVDAVSYAASLALVLAVRRPLGGGSRSTALVHDIADGLRLVLRSRFIVVFMTWAALVNFATGGLSFGLVLVIGPGNGAQLGFAMTVVALAGIVGAGIAPRPHGLREDTLVRVATAATVVLGALIVLRPVPVVVTACVAGIGLFGPIVTVLLNARLFTLVPDDMMGRVQSSLFLIGGLLSPFAIVLSGWLSEITSFTVTFTVFTGVLVVALVTCFLPGRRLSGGRPTRGRAASEPSAAQEDAQAADAQTTEGAERVGGRRGRVVEFLEFEDEQHGRTPFGAPTGSEQASFPSR